MGEVMKNIDKKLENSTNLDMTNIARKIVKTEKNILHEYEIEKKKLLNLYKKKLANLDEFGKSIEKYSTFCMGDIGPVIADLFTLYNGEKYEFVHRWKEHKIYEYFVGSVKNKRKKVSVLTLSTRGATLPHWCEINFYYYNKWSLEFENVLKYYPYLKEFINYVVEYRFNNKLETIDLFGLKKCLHDFVILHMDEIEAIQNYVKKENKCEYDAKLQLVLSKLYLGRKVAEK